MFMFAQHRTFARSSLAPNVRAFPAWRGGQADNTTFGGAKPVMPIGKIGQRKVIQ